MNSEKNRHESLQKLLQNNSRWAKEIRQSEPEFFLNSAKGQSPEFLWFGCSDSRIPVSRILNCGPGEVFVHRNIANLVPPNDSSSGSVLQYAVDVLKVKHIIVCGHYGCGGVQAALDNNTEGIIDGWLSNIRNVINKNSELLAAEKEVDKSELLAELNVAEQIKNLASSETVRKAWSAGRELHLHGLIYDLKTGLLKDLGITVSSPEKS